ncbi:MAG: hypothetical protein C0609_00415 [Deltaproteobacteria bacterium]|nr:MAG: hypothetical protein C0609_00415 [Deltaproteobacteria bacterium]
MNASDATLYSGGARGAEAAFGENAAKFGVSEVNYTFDGHHIERTAHTVTLTDAELSKGDVTMNEVSSRIGRDYSKSPWMRRILQSIWHQINGGFQVFIIGSINSDGTVKGGTGWAAELGKMFNRPLYVFDQEKGDWFTWKNDTWSHEVPVISARTFCGTGTRNLTAAGEKAIEELFSRSFDS